MVQLKTLVGTTVIAALGGAFAGYSLTSPTTATVPPTNVDNISPQGSQVDYAAQRTNAALTKTIEQLQKENPVFNLNQTLTQHFDSEVRDPQWADQQENSYRNLFSETPELSGFALTNSQWIQYSLSDFSLHQYLKLLFLTFNNPTEHR